MRKFLTVFLALCLIGSATGQQNSMPGMDMPSNQDESKKAPKKTDQSPPGMDMPTKPDESTKSPNKTDQSMPGMQMPRNAKPNSQSQQATPEKQQGMPNMEMRTVEKTPSHVEDLQEPENADQKTGANLPVPNLLADVKTDPTKKLDDFVELAQQNNPTLKQAQALVRTSAGLARQAGLWPNPSVGYQGEQIRGGSYGGGEQGGFIQQTIVLGGKRGLRRDVFEQERKVNEIGVEEQKLNVGGAVRIQFYRARAQLRTVEIRGRLLQASIDAAATAHQLANVGQADAPDILQAEVEAEQAKLDYSVAQRQYIQAYHQLAALVGQPEMPLSLLEGDLDNPPEISADQATHSILQNSPSIRRAQQEATRAEAALKRDKRESFPDLSLRVGEQQNLEHDPATMRPVGAQSFATAGIQIPIFNRNQGNIAAARADLERNREEVKRIKFNLAQTAEPLIQQYLTNKLQAERYRTQMIPRAQRAYELYLQKYKNMAAAYPEVIISQRTLFQLQENYVQTLSELWSTAVQLQNFLLVDGLSSPQIRNSINTEINLPTGGSGAAQ